MREVFWSEGPPSLTDGVFAATWTLDHAVKYNPGGVNEPIQIAVLEKDKKQHLNARYVSNAELEEHKENIQEAKNYLRKYGKNPVSEDDVPDVPSPPS